MRLQSNPPDLPGLPHAPGLAADDRAADGRAAAVRGAWR
jgi:hypothetical protein